MSFQSSKTKTEASRGMNEVNHMNLSQMTQQWSYRRRKVYRLLEMADLQPCWTE